VAEQVAPALAFGFRVVGGGRLGYEVRGIRQTHPTPGYLQPVGDPLQQDDGLHLATGDDL
jgi:hypothetical protein